MFSNLHRNVVTQMHACSTESDCFIKNQQQWNNFMWLKVLGVQTKHCFMNNIEQNGYAYLSSILQFLKILAKQSSFYTSS